MKDSSKFKTMNEILADEKLRRVCGERPRVERSRVCDVCGFDVCPKALDGTLYCPLCFAEVGKV